jgi:tRNA dimethylallyltransferase
VRERWLERLEREGPHALHALLAEQAPGTAARIEPADRQRVVRALELLETGELAPVPEDSELWSEEMRHPTLLVGLVRERSELYRRIDQRVLDMVGSGAREEVSRADAAGASATARQALGFQELLAGDVPGTQRRTRQYARRQLTWMRKLAGVRMIDVTGRSPAQAAGEIDAWWAAPA